MLGSKSLLMLSGIDHRDVKRMDTTEQYLCATFGLLY